MRLEVGYRGATDDTQDLAEVGPYEAPLERQLAASRTLGSSAPSSSWTATRRSLLLLIDGRTARHPDLAGANRRGAPRLQPDVGDNQMWVSKRVPSSSAEAFRAALGDGLTPPRA